MRARHPIPRRWLMSDSRMGAAFWTALERMPRGSGVVFRHYDLPPAERRTLLSAVMTVARRRGLVVLGAGGLTTRHGAHNGRRGRGLVSRTAHSRREIMAAVRAGADAVFVSPVFATRSHPRTSALGVARFGLMIRGTPLPVIALGGMNEHRARILAPLGIHGWAGIDAWTVDDRRHKTH